MHHSGDVRAAARPRRRTSAPPTLHLALAARHAADREWFAELLRCGCAERVQVHACESASAVLRLLRRSRAASSGPERVLVLASLADMDPLQLMSLLTAGGRQAPWPVVAIAPGSGRELGPALLRSGAHEYLGESWLGPHALARATENARVRWSVERVLRAGAGASAPARA